MSTLLENLYILEMANNHQGSVEHGLRIIKEMGKITRKYNIKAGVKFQYRHLDTMIHPNYKNDINNKHIKRFLSTSLSKSEFKILVEEVKKEGMIAVCTPFDETSVQVCMEHEIEILKVASCSASDWPLLEAIAATKCPVIISTAGKSIAEIDKIYNFFTHREIEFGIMHCVALYPTPEDMHHLNLIGKLISRYPNIPIGYSGHEQPDNLDVVKIAIAKGVKILERHVGLNTDSIKLNEYSMNPEQVERWIQSSIQANKLCGMQYEAKSISKDEMDSLRSLSRGVYASRNLKKGEAITRKDVFFAMPCLEGQMISGGFYENMIASREYSCNEAIFESEKIDTMDEMQSIIHEARGMLNEANIIIGNQFEIELSHHYGMKCFRQTGALIVNVMNREYCKKIIIVLPGQKHPYHYHKCKEETFQLLWGDLEVILDNKTVNMKPADILTVQREQYHQFSTIGGAIFEEVSTTHIIGDSYYEDPKINGSDPKMRKTVLKNW